MASIAGKTFKADVINNTSNESGIEVNSTVQRIFEGTHTALSNRGGTLLSMTDVVAASGVSRATLYRYFSSKEVLLAEFSRYTIKMFREGVLAAVEGQETPYDIVRAVLAFTTRFTLDVQGDRILAIESQWAVDVLKENFPQGLSVINEVFEPVYQALERATGVELDRAFIGETIMRLQESSSLIAGEAYLSKFADLAPKFVDYLLVQAKVH